MTKKFVLEIEMENDATRLSGDLATMLRDVGLRILAEYGAERSLRPVNSRTIRDINGNTVGQWNIVEE